MPWSRGGTKSTDCAPEGFSPKAHYLFDSEIALVWDRDRVSDGHHSHREGKGRVACVCVCVCVCLCVCGAGIYVYTICDLSGTAAAALWNQTRNTLLIPLGQPSIKTWRIGFLLSQTVIHVPVSVCACVRVRVRVRVCCLILTLASVFRLCTHYCIGCANKHRMSSKIYSTNRKTQ